MDGQPAAFIDLPPRAAIPSHDVTPVEFLEGAESGMEEEILDQLKSLGYFENEAGETSDTEGQPASDPLEGRAAP